MRRPARSAVADDAVDRGIGHRGRDPRFLRWLADGGVDDPRPGRGAGAGHPAGVRGGRGADGSTLGPCDPGDAGCRVGLRPCWPGWPSPPCAARKPSLLRSQPVAKEQPRISRSARIANCPQPTASSGTRRQEFEGPLGGSDTAGTPPKSQGVRLPPVPELTSVLTNGGRQLALVGGSIVSVGDYVGPRRRRAHRSRVPLC